MIVGRAACYTLYAQPLTYTQLQLVSVSSVIVPNVAVLVPCLDHGLCCAPPPLEAPRVFTVQCSAVLVLLALLYGSATGRNSRAICCFEPLYLQAVVVFCTPRAHRRKRHLVKVYLLRVECRYVHCVVLQLTTGTGDELIIYVSALLSGRGVRCSSWYLQGCKTSHVAFEAGIPKKLNTQQLMRRPPTSLEECLPCPHLAVTTARRCFAATSRQVREHYFILTQEEPKDVEAQRAEEGPLQRNPR